MARSKRCRLVSASLFSSPVDCFANSLENVEPLTDPAQFVRRKGEAPHRADSRRKREVDAGKHAVESIALYFTVMTFAQKAIDMIRAFYQKAPEDEDKVSNPGLDDGELLDPIFLFVIKGLM